MKNSMIFMHSYKNKRGLDLTCMYLFEFLKCYYDYHT